MKIHIVTDNEIQNSGSAGHISKVLDTFNCDDIGLSSWKDVPLHISGDP